MRFSALKALAAASTFAVGLIAVPAQAEPWKIDPAHGAVTFSVEHLGFSITQGRFRKFDAEIDFDPENIEAASVAFTIDAASVDTNWPERDKHVKSGDFLGVEEFPEITFVSKSVRLIDGDTAEVTGDLTIRDVTREETFTATMRRLGPSPFNPEQQVAGFVVEGEIDRTDYGVSYGAPAIGVTVPLRVDMEISPAG